MLIIIYRAEYGREKRIHKLQLSNIRRLSEGLEEWFEDFVDDILDEWKNNGFLYENVLISIAVWYGQNQEICRR